MRLPRGEDVMDASRCLWIVAGSDRIFRRGLPYSAG